MHGKPKIVCLCGSTRFKDAYLQAQKDETLKGHIVLSVGLFGHGEGIDMDGPVKAMLDELHLRKIDMADEILVLDPSVLVCGSCEKQCESTFHPVGGTGYSWSRCCRGPVAMKPYIGVSTRREILYAEAMGKPVRYLSEESE